MARRARWAVAGLAHHVLLQGHNHQVVLTDELDRTLFSQALQAALQAYPVVLHAQALLGDAVHLLLRPATAGALGACVQALGRRFVASYNLRHGRSGTPWNGRFRAAPLHGGEVTLQALLLIDGWQQALQPAAAAPQRWAGAARLVDPPELWALGNTPFEREQAYAERLQAGVSEAFTHALLAAVRRGLPLGSPSFMQQLETQFARPALARARGRPRLG